MRQFIIVLLVVVLFPAFSELRAEAPKDPDNVFYKRSKNYMDNHSDQSATKKRSRLDYYTTGDSLEDSRARAANGIWEDWSIELQGNLDDPENKSGEGPDPGEPEEKNYIEGKAFPKYMNSYVPMQGHMYTAMGDGLKDMIEKEMSGQVAKQMIALAQTEPGVFAGVDAAQRVVAENLNLYYQAREQYMDELPSDPVARQYALRLFNGCQFKAQNDGDARGWVNALLRCLGDSGEEPEQDEYHLKSSITAKNDEIKAEKDPTMDTNKSEDVVTASGSEEDKASLSVAKDLFNIDAKDDNAATATSLSGGNLAALTLTSGSTKSKVEKIAASWLDWFGDYRFKLNTEKNEKDGKVDNVRSRREYSEVRIAPKKKMAQIIRNITLNRYEDMTQLTYKYCDSKFQEAKNMQDAGSSQLDSPPDTIEKVMDQRFWNQIDNSTGNDTSVHELIKRLSVPEKPLQAATIEAIYDSFTYNYPIPLFYDFSSTETMGPAYCDCFNTNKPGTRESDGADITQMNEDSRCFDYVALIYDYSRFVAVSQVLRSLEEAEKFVQRRSAGPDAIPTSSSNMALSLIYDVAQIDDFRSAMEQNLLLWEEYESEKIFARRAKEIGQYGKQISEGVNRSQAEKANK